MTVSKMKQLHTLSKADCFSAFLAVVKIISDSQHAQRPNIICGGGLNRTRTAYTTKNVDDRDGVLLGTHLELMSRDMYQYTYYV